MKQELHVVVMPDGSLQPEWTDTKAYITLSSELMQTEIFRHFSATPSSWLLFLGFCDPRVSLSPSLSFFRRFSGRFIRKLTRTPDLESLRERAAINISPAVLSGSLEGVPMMSGAEYINRDLLLGVWANLSSAFSSLIQNHVGSVKSFVRSFSPDIHLVGRVFFHLVENKHGRLPFAFLATYSTRVGGKGRSKHLPLKHALKEYDNDSEKLLELLSPVQVASEKSRFIAGLYESGELIHPLEWPSEEALLFLKEVPLYEDAGIVCRIPDWWKGRASGPRLSVTIGEKSPSHVGLDAILTFNPQLMLGDMAISREEALKLIEASAGLSYIKNRWVAVNPEKLRQTLEAYEKAQAFSDREGIGIMDALRMPLNSEKIPGIDSTDIAVTVSRGRWLESVIEKMQQPELIPAVKPGKGFKATLRGYQQQGLDWLYFLHSIGFGACLADDMGLGKTVQLLAFLSVLKSKNGRRANLLVIPASLIANWIHEITTFFPNLHYVVAHPDFQPDRKVKKQSAKTLAGIDLVITTYALAQRVAWLGAYTWGHVILDEAQAIKNPGAKQTRAIKKLKAKNRIVMTGTPVENRLFDLWSLFDFVNPGLLGNKTEFGKFTKSLKDRPDGYKRLRTVVSPYILRRLKTDRSVISDLPDKVEMKTYASLSKKQVVLYKMLIQELAETIAETEGIKRKGLVLASLMKFKQLCNHPDQYMGSGGYEEKHSGKLIRLREICETISEKREKVLVFTQFKEITGPLSDFLETVFGREGLVFHGSVPVGKRKKIIEHFQSSEYVPFMILSLKAGGVGLNLTRANHVIHFDRWWNPAVENQATDRAFRIGQKKNVVVHKFLTKGTVEEKIDTMLEEKRALSEKVVSATGEGWITAMDNATLMDLFTLSL
jgi:SNF2 family DNA or RNA helicase